MKLPLPSLTALRAFECAARHESFTRAAEELFVTHGAVSRQIGTLERELGVALFERRHGLVRLTRRGLQLQGEVTASFMRLSEACERVRQRSRGMRALRVNAPPAFSLRWLIPRLSTFQNRHPAVELGLTNSVAPPDFASDEYDLAIRRLDRPPPPGWHAVPLFGEMSIPVCHVDLLPEGAPPMDVPALLRRTRLVRVAAEPRGWDKWARNWHADLSAARFLEVELTYLAVQATLEGLGVALLPLALVSDDIARGVLCAPLGPVRLDGSCYYVLTAKPPPMRSPAALCIEWLQAEGAECMRVASSMVDA